jgi:hypothetical protein
MESAQADQDKPNFHWKFFLWYEAGIFRWCRKPGIALSNQVLTENAADP